MNERISRILNHPMRTPVVVGVVSFAGGIGVGFFLGQRHNKSEDFLIYNEAEEEEQPQMVLDLDRAKDYIHTDQTKEVIPPEPVVIDAEDLLTRDGAPVKLRDILTESENGDEEHPVILERHSVFAEDDDDWDMEEELKNRNPELPYVLHKDEFYSNEQDYTQCTLSYYAGDDIMADEQDTPVYNYSQTVGELKFGHGSGDPNVFYVRNDKRKAEFEIVFNSGEYSVEVLGLEIENNERVKDIKHSNVPKFRSD